MRPIAPHGGNVPPLLAALGAREVFGREQGRRAGRAAEKDIGFADTFFQHARVFAVIGAHDAEVEFLVRLSEMRPAVGGVYFRHEGAGAREGPVDDVDVVDVRAAQEQGEPDVPEGLQAGAEDGDRVHGAAAGED